MIGYLSGEAVGPNVLSVCGVGYVLSTTKILEIGTHVQLWVTTIVREDSITLYGFETPEENLIFQALCKISGVGPGMALAVVRDVGVSGVLTLDPSVISRASGVGAKKASAIVSSIKIPPGMTAERERWHDVAETLISLGFEEKRSSEAAKTACNTGETDESKLLALALEEVRS